MGFIVVVYFIFWEMNIKMLKILLIMKGELIRKVIIMFFELNLILYMMKSMMMVNIVLVISFCLLFNVFNFKLVFFIGNFCNRYFFSEYFLCILWVVKVYIFRVLRMFLSSCVMM